MALTETPGVPQQLSQAMLGQLNAGDAYARATARLKYNRATQQSRSGLLGNWDVDPRAMYGTYQALLQRQGAELDDALNAQNERGLWGGGLANQPERILRYGQAVENLQYKQQLQDWEAEYQMGMGQAEWERQQELLKNAYPQYGDGDGGDGGDGDGGGDYPESEPGPPPPKEDPGQQVYYIPKTIPRAEANYYIKQAKKGKATPFSPGKPVKKKDANPYRRG